MNVENTARTNYFRVTDEGAYEEILVCQPEDVEGYLHPAKEYRIPYVSGETLKYREFTTKAASKEDAIADLYRKEGDFDHRILAVYENGVLIDEEVDG